MYGALKLTGLFHLYFYIQAKMYYILKLTGLFYRFQTYRFDGKNHESF